MIAPIRTPMVDAAGNLTPAWQRYFSAPPDPVVAPTPSPLAAPTAPTSPALTVTEYGDNYRITPTWTPPAVLGTTSAYEVQFKFYTDSGCTAAEGDWGGQSSVTGGAASSLVTDLWPKANAPRWVRCRVRALNADNAYTSWVESAAGSGAAITASSAGTSPGAPTQPTLSNWSVGTITISPDVNKDYYVGITLTEVGAPPGDSAMLQFFIYEGAAPPSDPGLWQNCGDTTAAGSFVHWRRHPGAAATWCVCAVGSRFDWAERPSGSTPYRTINISAVGTPAAISGATAALQTQVNDGTQQFRYEFAFTAPSSSDQNYRLTVLEAAWVDVTTGAWVGGVSKWERVLDITCYGATVAYLGNDPRWTDCLRPGATAGRRRWRIRSVNWNDEPTLASQPADISNSILTPVEPYTDGIDLSAAKAASVDSSLAVRGGQLGITARGLLTDGDFEAGGAGWTISSSGVIDTSVKYSGTRSLKLVGDGATAQYARQAVQAVPGQAYQFSVACRNDSTSALYLVAQFLDAAGVYISDGIQESAWTAISPGVWQQLTRTTVPAPAGTAYLMIYPVYAGSLNVGNFWVDAVSQPVPVGVVTAGPGSLGGVSVSVISGPDTANGEQTYRIRAQWTPETPTLKRQTVRAVYLATGDVVEREISNGPISKSGFETSAWPKPSSAVSATVTLYVASIDGAEVVANTASITIPAGASGTLLIGNAKSGVSTLGGDITLSRGAAAGQIDLTTGGFQASITTAGVQNKVNVDSSGITISQGTAGGSLVANASGLVISKTTSGVTSKTDINSTGVQIRYGTTGGITTVDSTGVKIEQSNFYLQASAAGVTIRENVIGGGVLTLDSSGMVVSKGSSSVTVAAGGVTIVNGILNSPTISVVGSLFSTVINATDGFKATFTGGVYSGQTVKIQADGVVVEKSSWQGVRLSAPAATIGGRLALSIDDVTPVLEVIADPTSNRITSARSSSYLDFSNSASYVKAGHFRLPNAVSGTKTPVGGGAAVTGWFKEVCEQDGTPYYVQIFT